MKRFSRDQRRSPYGEMALGVAGSPILRHGMLALVCAMILSLPKHAAAEWIDITPEEFGLLPKYCPYTMGQTTNYSVNPNSQHWRSLMGPDFDHMHHYCWGLAKVMRVDRAANALRWTKAQRDFKLNDAAGEFNYVIRNTSPTFAMLPEVLVKYGAVLERLRRDKDAIAAFEKAIEKKQDYAPAYLKLSEMLFERGNRVDAKKVAEEGLKYSPNSKSLKTLLADIQKASSKEPAGASDRSSNSARGRVPE